MTAMTHHPDQAELVDTPMGAQPFAQAVRWHLPTILRWLRDHRDADRAPDGTLVGEVLRIAAETIERRPTRSTDNPPAGDVVEAGAAALFRVSDFEGQWAELSELSKQIYREKAHAVLLATAALRQNEWREASDAVRGGGE